MLLSLPKIYNHLRCIHDLSRPHADGRDISVRLKHYRELSLNRQRGRAFLQKPRQRCALRYRRYLSQEVVQRSERVPKKYFARAVGAFQIQVF